METIIYCLVLTAGSIVLANLGLWAVRSRVPIHATQPSHEVGGYLFAALATLYAVLLGLIVVDAMGKFQEALHETEQESNSLAHIYFLAEQLPSEKKQQIKSLCKQYADSVVAKEWDAMDKHTYCPESRVLALTLVKNVYNFKPANDAENTIYGAAINEASEFWSTRRSRIITATHAIPGVEWFAVLAGGVATVVFTYFFGTEKLSVQVAMTSMVTFLISLNLLLLWMFGQPYEGCFKVSPESFQGDLKIFEGDLSRVNTGADNSAG